MNAIRKLVEDYPDNEGEALRYAGYRRSKNFWNCTAQWLRALRSYWQNALNSIRLR
jgi:hypothetical protein